MVTGSTTSILSQLVVSAIIATSGSIGIVQRLIAMFVISGFAIVATLKAIQGEQYNFQMRGAT